jgi:hypothetical protein
VNKNYYTLVYFNTGIMTGSGVSEFREFLSTMPQVYLEHLSTIILVHANFMVKSGLYWTSNEIQKYVKKLTEYSDT